MRLVVSYLIALITAVALIVPTWSSLQTVRSFQREAAVESGKLDPMAHALSLAGRNQVSHPGEWVATARAIDDNTSAQNETAIALLRAALAEDERDPGAWAHLSFLLTRQAGSFSEEAQAALRKSVELCPYCETSLLKWRFTFVLSNWDNVPEDLRMAAFSGADLLRWWHLEYDFLADVRTEALALGIPYDEYRTRIDTPMRKNEIGL